MNESSPLSGQWGVMGEIRRALGREETLTPAALEPFIEETREEYSEATVAHFIRELSAVGGRVHRADTPADACSHIVAVCAEAGEVAVTGSTLFTEMGLATQLAAAELSIFELGGPSAHEREALVARLASCGVGVTGVDYAIAETGTIVLSSDEESSLLVSLLPAIHIAVMRAEQISASLTTVIAKLKVDRMGRTEPCRAATFITGPSRTSDVELVLSIGVHGPKELHVVVL